VIVLRRLAAIGIVLPLMSAAPMPDAAGPIVVDARPITHFENTDPTLNRFGALLFRGGLVLSSADPRFGGWSGLRLNPDGERLTAISDRGHWLRARLVYEAGRPQAVRDAVIAPAIGPNGPLPGSRDFDAESLEIANGVAFVGIERTHKILRFPIGQDGMPGRGVSIPLPPGMTRGVQNNQGFEGVGVVPSGKPNGGALVVVTEEQLDEAGNHVAWLVGGGTPGRFAVKRRDGYAISDLAFLPSGDIIILERRFRPPFFLTIRLRRLPIAGLRRGALLDGPILFEASLAEQIDNMEGIAVHRGREGETVLTLISDDNFSAFQRTLLLQFTLKDER